MRLLYYRELKYKRANKTRIKAEYKINTSLETPSINLNLDIRKFHDNYYKKELHAFLIVRQKNLNNYQTKCVRH